MRAFLLPAPAAHALPLLLGLELTRFAAGDGGAGALAGSLDAVQSGGWTLAPYEGPAIQPYLGLRLGAFEAHLAPAVAFQSETASSADGRDGTVRAFQWRAGGRVLWCPGAGLAGIEGAYADGSAALDGETVARSASVAEVGPTAGVRGAVGGGLSLVLRVRVPVRFSDASTDVGFGGAVGIEWRRASSSP